VGLAVRRRRSAPPQWGSVDLALVIGLVFAVSTRTPVGGLARYAWGRVLGHRSTLPTLTSYFSDGATAPPVAEVSALPPEPAPPPPDDPHTLPEPWRTAARAALAGGVPAPLADRITASGAVVSDTAALRELDALWATHGDAEAALEVAAIGSQQRQRAIGRAQAAGEPHPARYAQHRRYLGSRTATEADRFVSATMGLATVLDLEWPLQRSHRVTSPFGDREHPVLGGRRFHNGIDLSVPVGTPVYAAQSGRVAVVGEGGASGRYVVVDHGNGVQTSYSHLERAEVPQGAPITRGQLVARSGNTGRSTGPHLHYVVRIGGRPVDPARFRP